MGGVPLTDSNPCVEGKASFTLNGRSLAQAEAKAVATSFAEGLIEASACDFCDVAADFIADSFEEIIVQATALAEADLVGFTDGARVEASADVLAERIVSASATAFAKVCTCTVCKQFDFVCGYAMSKPAPHLI